METKANSAVVGAFTLAVLAFGFGFVYWLADSGISKENMTIVFRGQVAGLDVGSPVYFNGIPVGNVHALQFDANDPSNVLARVSVDAETPIKKDSTVSLGYTGITGVAYVDIVGGTLESERRLDGSGNAVMYAQRSSFEDLVAGARQIMAKADTTLETIENLVTENAPAVENTLTSVEKFTGALAENSDEVSNFLESISGAANAIADISGQLKGVVAKAETLLADVDSKKVQETIDNIANASKRLDGLVERSETIVASIDPSLVTETTEKIANAAGRLDGIVARGEEIAAAVDPEKVRKTVDDISQMAGDIRSFAKQGEEVLAAIDPTKIGETVDNITSASDRIDGVAEQAQTLLSSVDPKLVEDTARNISDVSSKLGGLVDRGEEILTAVDPQKVGEAVDSVSRVAGQIEGVVKRGDTILAAVDPEKVSRTVDGISSLAGTLSERRAEIDNMITSLSVNLTNAEGFTARLPEIGRKAEDVLTAVDVEKINQSIENVHQFTTALGNSSDDVDAIVANVRGISEQVSGLLAKIDGIAGSEDGQGLIVEARETLRAIRVAADTFAERARSIGGGVDRFANQGLRELQAFVREGRRAVSRLDRLIANIDRNPSQVIYGGDNVPRYRGGQRR